MLRFFVTGLFLIAGTMAHALGVAIPSGKASCKQGPNTRRVEIEPGETDTKQSCQVRYFKDQEAPGEGKVLWTATNADGYCTEKAKGFVAKLTGMGWACDGDLADK